MREQLTVKREAILNEEKSLMQRLANLKELAALKDSEEEQSKLSLENVKREAEILHRELLETKEAVESTEQKKADIAEAKDEISICQYLTALRATRLT